MKTIIKVLILTVTFFISIQSKGGVFEPEYVESPYFQTNSQSESLNLYKNKVDVRISDTFADVKVTQFYKNEGEKAIEAVYVFPASSAAAVYNLKLNVNGRITKAVIKEKKEARQTYETAKKEGKSASLLFQKAPNVFTMNVANILPGDTIQVELNYVEKLVTTDGKYKFYYPVSVGPRYGDSEVAAIPKDFENEINLSITSALPVKDIVSKHHKVEVQEFNNKTELKTIFTISKKPFIVEYNLRGDSFSSGLQLYEEGNEKFFMLTIQPPKSPNIKTLIPREYIFIVDVSGSMNGFPTETSKKMMAELLYQLQTKDRFNIIQFAGGQTSLFDESMPVNNNSLDQAFAFIEMPDGSGGTEILPALEKALKSKKTTGYNRSIIVITDGLVDVDKEAFDLVRQNLGNSNLFSFGVYDHYGVNENIIRGLARIGQTDPLLINNDSDITEMVNMFIDYVSYPLLADIEIDYGSLAPKELTNNNYGDIYTDRPLIISGKWEGDISKPIKVSGNTINGGFIQEIKVIHTNNLAVKYLWAKDKLEMLNFYDGITGSTDELQNEITSIGLKYNLLTEYTSFVAVDEVIRNTSGLPQKTSENAPPALTTSGFGFEESTVALPISSVKPSYKEISGVKLLPVGKSWVQKSLTKTKISNIKPIQYNDLNCLKNKSSWLRNILSQLDNSILSVNGVVYNFIKSEEDGLTCTALLEVLE